MFINKLELINFRSWRKLEISFDRGISVFVAPNGSGKTNVVESIYYLANLRSHRTFDDKRLINFDSQNFLIRAQMLEEERIKNIGLELGITTGKKIVVNNNEIKQQQDYLGTIKTVIFSPEDIQLIKGEPQLRRKFLDDTVATLYRPFYSLKKEYDHVVKQKSALLKSEAIAIKSSNKSKYFESTLKVWNEKLVKIGAQVLLYRLIILSRINKQAQHKYQEIAIGVGSSKTVNDRFTIQYVSSVLGNISKDLEFYLKLNNRDKQIFLNKIETSFAAAIQHNTALELSKASSIYGPHRDDYMLLLNDNLVKYYASQGEIWSCAVALKLATVNLFRVGENYPIVILDDVFTELDEHRRYKLERIITELKQVMITTPLTSYLPKNLTYQVYQIKRQLDEKQSILC